MASEWDFSITQGTDRQMELTLLDEDDNPLILERVWVTVKRLRLDAEAKALATKNSHDNGNPTPAEIAIVDLNAGRADVFWVPADTEGIAPGDYWWDCKVKTTAGLIHSPIREAKFTVESTQTTRAS